MTTQHYCLIDHTADSGMLIYGRDPADLFTHAGLALFEMIGDFNDVQKKHRRIIALKGADWADLMVNWLRELLYLWNGQEQIVTDIMIQSIQHTGLKAEVSTDDFSIDRHAVQNEIKAVTYHQIEVGPHRHRWRARVIFDI